MTQGLQKQNLQLNFSQGLDTKTDPFQVKPGKMELLQNTIFDKIGRFAKRNGHGLLPLLPDTSFTDINTYQNNLIAVGNSFQFFNDETSTWINKGLFQPLDVQVTPMVRNSNDQIAADTAIAPNGLACTAYINIYPATPSLPFYQIVDSNTGHIVVPSVALPAGAGQQVMVNTLGNFFIVSYPRGSSLEFIAIPWATPATPNVPATLIANIKVAAFSVFDAIVLNNQLFAAALLVSNNDIGYQRLNANLTLGPSATSATTQPSAIAMVADVSTGHVWSVWRDENDSIVKAANFTQALAVFLGRTNIATGVTFTTTITGAANGGQLMAFWAVGGATSRQTITEAGVVGTVTVVTRGAFLGAKAFYFGPTNTNYILLATSSPLQSSFYLMDFLGNIIAELAYQNGGGTASNLANVYISGNQVQMGYLLATQIQPINKNQGGTGTAVYAMHGVNLVTFTFSNRNLIFNEIAGDHHFTGGFLWMYDGVKPVEHGFFQFPEGVTAVNAAGGSITAQLYYYYVTYEWTDAAGNIHRSAPSVPLAVTAIAASKTTLTLPTLKLTYKDTANPVRIVVYRWSTAQPIPYQVTKFNFPVYNDKTVDSVTFVDNLSDAQIIGNLILYTTGGVVEDIVAPACAASTLFKSRMFLVKSEDRNLLWFSKQVIENVPVEFSDLFTIYVPPTIGALGNTGPIITISAMDDKLVIFKRNAIYYITGNGPDLTGAQNDFSDPIFITATVGCVNLKSVVLTPIGLIFQSDKGIWLLARDLQTTYIGAPVEFFNSANVIAAQTILGETQVRLTLDSGVTLVYDYFYQQWMTFVGIPGISTTIYQNLLTYLSTDGRSVFKETPGVYLDGTNPVNMKFTTAWINLAGLQAFERAYFFYLLASYFSPHTLTVEIAYDYDPAIVQTTTINPNTESFGSPNAVEQWRVFFAKQKCQAFQLTITEAYDPTLGQPAGAGLSLSGLNLVVGAKNGGYPRLKAAVSAG